jgi:hypothetical protein
MWWNDNSVTVDSNYDTGEPLTSIPRWNGATKQKLICHSPQFLRLTVPQSRCKSPCWANREVCDWCWRTKGYSFLFTCIILVNIWHMYEWIFCRLVQGLLSFIKAVPYLKLNTSINQLGYLLLSQFDSIRMTSDIRFCGAEQIITQRKEQRNVQVNIA